MESESNAVDAGMIDASSSRAIGNRVPDALRRFLPAAAILLLLGLAFWPVPRWYALRLDDGSDEPWGLVALVAALVLGGRAFGEGISGPGRRERIIWIVGIAAYSLGYPWLSPLPRALLAVTLIVFGFGLVRRAPGVAGLLFLSLPVLATAQFYLGWPLRWIVAVGAESVLGGVGVEVAREGVILLWNGEAVSVDAPCSGVRMLWAGLFAHFALCAGFRLNPATVGWTTPLVILGIIGANVVRAVLLFFPEAGWIEISAALHEGIGLLVFGGLLVLLVTGTRRIARPGRTVRTVRKAESRRPFRKGDAWLAVGLCLIAALAPLLSPKAGVSAQPTPDSGSIAFPGWPSRWEGELLRPIRLSEREEAFASSFPGRLGVFETAGGRRIILRWVTRPTRKLHSSADCLRASGYRVEKGKGTRPGESRAVFSVFHPDHGHWTVSEQIRSASGERRWAEVEAWFWSAAMRGGGPWWAVTAMEPGDEPRP